MSKQAESNIINTRKLFYVMIILAMVACSPSVSSTGVNSTETPSVTDTLAIPTETPTPLPPSVTPVPTLGIGSIQIRSSDDAVMMYIPDGKFIMGSNDAGADEGPEHVVHLIDYWIDRTEVTNGMYAKCVTAGSCDNPGTSQRGSKYDTHPVAEMHWVNAQEYCAWAGARLPTEAEWEKAARGTEGWAYSWGNELDPTKYYLHPKPEFNSPLLEPVGSYPSGASPYGVLDMTGGVFEWVKDIYSPTYYEISPLSNPVGPTSENGEHVIRGGSYVDYDLRVFRRTPRIASTQTAWAVNTNVGFRCAMDTDY